MGVVKHVSVIDPLPVFCKTNILIALAVWTLVGLYFGLIGAQVDESMFVHVSLGKISAVKQISSKLWLQKK